MTSSIYIIGADGCATVKIGVSTNVPSRLKSIQNMCPLRLRVLWSGPGDRSHEMALHKHFASWRSHGEWFTFEQDPVPLVIEVMSSLPPAVHEEPSASIPQQRTPPNSEFVSFEDAALVLRHRGLDPGATGDSVRYLSRSRRDWPIGPGRPHAYGKAGNARTIPVAALLEFYGTDPKAKGRGPDKRPRRPKQRS